jgi:hypothetical protein
MTFVSNTTNNCCRPKIGLSLQFTAFTKEKLRISRCLLVDLVTPAANNRADDFVHRYHVTVAELYGDNNRSCGRYPFEFFVFLFLGLAE